MLEIARRRGDADRLVHHPLADVQVGVDPFLDVLVLGDLLGGETGPGCVSLLVFSSCLFRLCSICHRVCGCLQGRWRGREFEEYEWWECLRQAGAALHAGEDGGD